jgi:2-polyprenyl-3-methyl-5-hydroxy-6-metoxy-1,4-benzoquinol methylase
MSGLTHYTRCPVCGSEEIRPKLSAKDYTVSGENFSVFQCSNCSLCFTQDAPDAGSIAPYYKSENYISHTNSSKGLINRLYQSVRKRTLKQKRRLVEKMTGLPTGRLLDVGSGTGAFAAAMQQAGWDVTGLEPDADARMVAGELYRLKLEDSSSLYDLPAASVDAITLWHVLEHVHDLQSYVQQLKKLLKPTGRLFIAVPNYTSKDAETYKANWAAWDVPRHLYHFSPRSMETLMEKNGMKILAHRPMWYDSFYISLLSSKYANKGRANLPAAFWNGLRSNIHAMRDVKKCSSVIYVVGK